MADKNRNWGNQSNQDWDRNRGRNDRDDDYNRENLGGDAGQYGNDHNRNRGMQGNYGESGYTGGTGMNYGNRGGGQQYGGSAYGDDNDQNRRQRNWGSAGMYGGDYGREDDWKRSNVNTGYDYGGLTDRNYGSSYGSGHQGRQGRSYGNENRYGGDSRNYGNANQGGYERDWWERTRDEVSSWFGDDEAERRRRQDKQRMGQHRGKGPKGYNRTDERILEDVCDRLSDDDRVDATNIEVKVVNGEVTLSGTVSDREQKRRAEDIVESLSGVKDVENHIKVKREDVAHYTGNQIT